VQDIIIAITIVLLYHIFSVCADDSAPDAESGLISVSCCQLLLILYQIFLLLDKVWRTKLMN